jgi:hypothetical protein
MNLVRKCSSLLLLAFLAVYGGLVLAAPVVPHSGKSASATVAEAQPEKPVDCKKYPTHPDCKKTQ